MKKEILYLFLLVITSSHSNEESDTIRLPVEVTQVPITTIKGQTEALQVPNDDEEAIVEDENESLESTEMHIETTHGATERSQMPLEEEEMVEVGDQDEATHHHRHKRDDTRRRLGMENDPDLTRGTLYTMVHDSSHLHKYQLKIEDEMGAGAWAMRWYHDTTKTIYRNVTIELLTLANVETKNWVTVCPGHNHIKFKVKTGSDAVIYLADRFFPGDTSAFKYNQFDNINSENKPFGNYIQIRIGDGAEAKDNRENTWPWTSLVNMRDQRSYICYNERRLCRNYFARHVHPLVSPLSSKEEEDRTSDGNRERYLSRDEYRGFWIWWEPSGMVLVGKENEPPFMAYYVSKYFKKKWKIRAIGFGDRQDTEGKIELVKKSLASGGAHYHITMLFPIHDDPNFEEHNDELDDRDIDV